MIKKNNDKKIDLIQEELSIELPQQYKKILLNFKKEKVYDLTLYQINGSLKNIIKKDINLIEVNKKSLKSSNNIFIFAHDSANNKLCFKRNNNKLSDEVYIWDKELKRLNFKSKNIKSLLLSKNKSKIKFILVSLLFYIFISLIINDLSFFSDNTKIIFLLGILFALVKGIIDVFIYIKDRVYIKTNF